MFPALCEHLVLAPLPRDDREAESHPLRWKEFILPVGLPRDLTVFMVAAAPRVARCCSPKAERKHWLVGMFQDALLRLCKLRRS